MEVKDIFTLETPYRDALRVRGAQFGGDDAEPCCAIVGSMRGNEVQQTFIAANLVKRLQKLEKRGFLTASKRILVIPSVNAYSLNIHERFWPVDNTDINRMFPGYDKGETTQRIAAGLFSAVQGWPYGIQLASFYLRGRFLPHVRITDEGDLSKESLELASLFGMPYTLLREPSTFDTTTLNYNWQVWDTHAFSVYSKQTGSIDEESAREVEDGIVRFLVRIGAADEKALATCLHDESSLAQPVGLAEESLVDVRAEKAGGFYLPCVDPGDEVGCGELLATVLDSFDGHVKEHLVAPVAGKVFFERSAPLINQYSIAFKIAPK